MSTQNTKSDAAAAAAAPNEECTSTEMLFESAVAGRWNELSSFCNSYTHPPDTPLNPNPLFAAVLHTAILMAAKHKSTTIFADTPPKELVTSVGLAIGGADFCPYKFDESDQDASFRRRAIAQLCRICPGWISAPLVGHCKDNEDIANRTTALHLAVRMRNPSLVKLFLKYCPEASKVQDDLGYLPLHYAVRPVDEVVVYSKAVLAHSSRTNVSNNSLIGPADLPNIQNMDVGGGTAGGVSFGMRMVHRGKHMLGGINDICMLSRHRLRREMLEKKRKCIASKKRLNAINGRARTKAADKAGESSDNTSSSKSNEGNSSSKTNHHSARRSSRIKKNDDLQQAKATQYLLFSNLYTSSSSLVRAMMFIGCVDEDSPKFIEAENHACASEYPVISGSRGKIRQSRAWKSESHRVEVVRMLLDAYPQGMGVACNSDPEVKDEDLPKELLGGGGETPLIMAVRTFKGGGPEEDEEEDFNMDMMNLDAVGGPNNNAAAGAVAGGGNIGGGNVMMNAGPINDAPADVNIAAAPNENVANSVAEEDAEYEMGLPSVERNDGPVEDNANNQVPQAPQDNINEGEQIEDLELIRILIRTATRINDFSAFSRTNDDGDTSLHAAVRIGAHHRVVTLLLNAYPEAASMLANDAATPLHLLLRRCSHLAPEGVGSLSTYNVDMVQAMINASGDSVMTLPNSDSRTPLHEAVYYGASPDVLDTLANRPAGRIALLLRDSEGHTPLGAYCRHAADFYGMRVLVNLCPNAAAALGDGKRVALHRVLASFNLAVNVDVLNLLGTAYPRGINLKDSHKMTPLALLCQSYKGPMNVDLPKLLTNRTSLGRCLSNKVRNVYACRVQRYL
jgi:ankyrin repeat protein